MRARRKRLKGIVLTALLASSAATAAASDPVLPGDSIYHLGGSWTDTKARTVPLVSLRGTVSVAAMFYASCDSACPIVVSDLQRIERELGEASREKVRFVLFSLDPARDTSTTLASFAAKRGLEGGRWLLLTSTPDRVRELSAVLGVDYRADSTAEIAHSSVISVIDRNGVIRGRITGVRQNPRNLVRLVRKLLGESP